MERAGLGTAMLMLTALSVIAPAAEWIGGSAPTNPLTQPSTQDYIKPSRSSQDLRHALKSQRDTTIANNVLSPGRRPSTAILRDPFATAALATTAAPTLEPALPVIVLIGIIDTPDGGIATLSIDGNIVSLRIGESAGNVKLESMGLPDTAVVIIGGRKITVRVQ